MRHIGKPIKEPCSTTVIIHKHNVVGLGLGLLVESSKMCIDSTCSALQEIKLYISKTCPLYFQVAPQLFISVRHLESFIVVELFSIELSMNQTSHIAKSSAPELPLCRTNQHHVLVMRYDYQLS
jgi:hypothetical protein